MRTPADSGKRKRDETAKMPRRQDAKKNAVGKFNEESRKAGTPKKSGSRKAESGNLSHGCPQIGKRNSGLWAGLMDLGIHGLMMRNYQSKSET